MYDWPGSSDPGATCQANDTPAAPAPTPVPTAAPEPAAAAPNAAARPAPTPAAQSVAQPKTGGTLRIGRDVTNLEPMRNNPAGFATNFTLYDRLTEYDDQMQPQPRLAESWEFAPDRKTITLHLRHGVTYHSGRDFTSDDIKYNIARAANPKTGTGQYAELAAWFNEIETPDKYTAVMHMNDSQTAVFDLFEQLNITDRETMEGPDAATRPVGTGPFKFVESVQGDHFTVARNPNYWMAGKPYLDTVETRILVILRR